MKNTKKSNATEALDATTFFILVQAHDAPRIMQRVAAGRPRPFRQQFHWLGVLVVAASCSSLLQCVAVLQIVMKWWGQGTPLRESGIPESGNI